MRNAQTGRRRGRGNPRPPQGGHNDRGNRIEPRQRGNAIQLLEKYNNLAREAHQQGDRVQAETYLQYADHYHRVVAEMRARQEERQPQQQQQGERRERGRDDRDSGNQGEGARYERDDDDRDEDDGADDDGVSDNNAASQRVEAPRYDRDRDSDDDDSDDEGALRTLARSARLPEGNDDDSQPASETRADDGGSSERPRRQRGRPRRSPREPVEA